jgi:hypothetical protein
MVTAWAVPSACHALFFFSSLRMLPYADEDIITAIQGTLLLVSVGWTWRFLSQYKKYVNYRLPENAPGALILLWDPSPMAFFFMW